LVWGAKKICTRKRSFRLGRHGCVKGFQTFTRLRGYLASLNIARDVWASCVVVVIWCEEPKQEDLWFNYHAHRQIRYVHFICKADGKILFYYIFFLDVVLYEKYLTSSSFLLHAKVFGSKSRLMQFFIETHMRNDDCQKMV
jgi:hypothetical protein